MSYTDFHYQNYTFPLAGVPAQLTLGDTEEQSWIWRNWPIIMSILGTAFIVGGLVGSQIVDRSGVPDEPISPEDWDMIIQAAQKVRPEMPRQEVITKLCAIFGPRAPYCVDMTVPSVVPGKIPGNGLEQPPKSIPTWVIVAGIGAVVFLFLK